MSSSELKEKTEHTSITGTEWLYLQLAETPYTVLKIALDTIKDWMMLDYLFPVGTVVFQPPAAESDTESVAFPVADRPATKWGGTWSELYEDEAIVFRTFGESYSRSSGYQADAMQGHMHDVGTYVSIGGDLNITYGSLSAADGVFKRSTVPVTDGTNGTPRTDSETRMKNRRMKVWIRTA